MDSVFAYGGFVRETPHLRGGIPSMRCTLDSKGRVLIPKMIREELGLKPGMPVSISFRDGRIEIEPATLLVRLIRKGEFLVAVPMGPVARLTRKIVEDTRKRLNTRPTF